MKSFLIRGVPLSMQQDGWWLNANPPSGEKLTSRRRDAWVFHAVALLGLVALGDVLMWGVAPGVSLAIFAAAVVAIAALLWPTKPTRRTVFLTAGLTLLAVLPLVELVQPLSLLFFFAGLPLALSALAGRPLRGAFRYWWAGPIFAVRDCVKISAGSSIPRLKPGAKQQFAMTWGLPLGVGLIFASLLIQANPILQIWVSNLIALDVNLPSLDRLMFWLGLAVLVWPALSLVRFAPTLSPDPKQRIYGPRKRPKIVNAAALVRSLVLFNGLFLFQNIMDLSVLSGGVRVPDGISYAQYAHQGAYPLLLLAVLSGGFALLARPFIVAAPVLRSLLLIWMGQTVFLTISSGLRLQLYVDVYGLTYLRMSAGIWMALVACGLMLIFWQVLKNYQNTWMLKRIGALGFCALYLCSFVSFDAAIARYNLTQDVQSDRRYICSLGEAAVPEILRHTGKSAGVYCPTRRVPKISTPRDWREWGFRNARVRRSFAKLNQIDGTP